MKGSGVLLLGLCLLGTIACSDDGAAPSNLPLVFTANLTPAAEVPPISNAENTGLGAVQISFDVVRDGTGAITSGTVGFHFQLSNFPSSTTVVAAHIHTAPSGVNGPIIVNTGIVAAAPVAFSNGVATFSVSGISVPAATIQAIVNNPAGYYFNVHSPANPGGFSRGQLNRTL
jgi:hypothetical protein